MTEEYRHDGGSNRAYDPAGNLIGWFVYTGSEGTNLELVDREGMSLTVERTAGGIVVRDQAGEVRIPRPVTLDDPFYLAVVIVSRRLGHASVSFTLDKYSHRMPDDDQQAALAVAALLDASVPAVP